jgi:hypothetical protein
MNPAIEFMFVQVGRMFHLNGNDYLKMSRRTAKMLSTGNTVYINRLESVHIIAN